MAEDISEGRETGGNEDGAAIGDGGRVFVLLLATKTVGNAPKVPACARSAHSLFGSIGTTGIGAMTGVGAIGSGAEVLGGGTTGAGVEAIGSGEGVGVGGVGGVGMTATFGSILAAGALAFFRSSFCCWNASCSLVAPSDRKSTRLNSSHITPSRMPSSA